MYLSRAEAGLGRFTVQSMQLSQGPTPSGAQMPCLAYVENSLWSQGPLL